MHIKHKSLYYVLSTCGQMRAFIQSSVLYFMAGNCKFVFSYIFRRCLILIVSVPCMSFIFLECKCLRRFIVLVFSL